MTRTVTIDLDGANVKELESLWRELERRRDTAAVDPELRAAVVANLERRVADGLMGEQDAALIREELETCHPSVVLEAHWKQIIPNLPTIGALRKPALPEPVDTTAWANERYRRDPERYLGELVADLSEVVPNETQIARAAISAGIRAGLDIEAATAAVGTSLAALRQAKNGSGHCPL